MTVQRDLKKLIRDRQRKTGESYTTARRHVTRVRDERLGVTSEVRTDLPEHETVVDAAVLKVNQRSIRARILGEEDQVTFRGSDAHDVVPGHVVTLSVQRRWVWLGDAYASGTIDDVRIDVGRLGLAPLPLTGGELEDIAADSEPCRPPDPYAALWKKLTAKPRPAFEFDGIAWGASPGADIDDNPTCEAAELVDMGDLEGAREILMDALCVDLRCIDAHAHLGNLEFARAPERASVHYEIGVRIAELSLPNGFDGLLQWGMIYNRPFLRCLHGHALCLWRVGQFAEAQRVFERVLSLNPDDAQGARFCWDDVRKRRSWEEMSAREEAARAAARRSVQR